MPWLQSYDYSVSQIEEQINAATETLGDDASYILCNPDGNYRFTVKNTPKKGEEDKLIIDFHTHIFPGPLAKRRLTF